MPYWGELDASVSEGQDRMLLVRPAVNLREGFRYVVGIRNLKNAAGDAIAPTDAFRAMRDGLETNVAVFNARRPHFEQIFSELDGIGWDRASLFLAWDFTVTSAEVAAIGSEWLIVLEVEVHNATSEGGNQDGHYYGMADFEALRVDDFANEPVCFSPQKGDRDDVTPTERASGLVGFELTSDPTGAALDLELDRGAIIEITSRA